MIDAIMAAVITTVTPELAPVDTTTVVTEEDSPQWECRTMGNLVCGPGNAQGVTPGDYSDDTTTGVEIS
jgi:hypothetical protein